MPNHTIQEYQYVDISGIPTHPLLWHEVPIPDGTVGYNEIPLPCDRTAGIYLMVTLTGPFGGAIDPAGVTLELRQQATVDGDVHEETGDTCWSRILLPVMSSTRAWIWHACMHNVRIVLNNNSGQTLVTSVAYANVADSC